MSKPLPKPIYRLITVLLKILLPSLAAIFLLLQSSQVNASRLPANSVPKQERPLRIAVAANFAPALKILLAEWPDKSHIDYQIISAASGTLYQQITHGAPFDLFLSADASRPKKLEQAKLIVKNSRKTYAYGQIALWSATQPLQDLNLLNSHAGHLAIANPNTAPYGKAAHQALSHLGLWSRLENQLVTGININQTFQQVRSQAVPLGIVAYSQLKINRYQGVKIPAQYYQPIAQQLTIIKSSSQVALAQRLSDFILHTRSQKKLQQLGYLSTLTPKHVLKPLAATVDKVSS